MDHVFVETVSQEHHGHYGRSASTPSTETGKLETPKKRFSSLDPHGCFNMIFPMKNTWFEDLFPSLPEISIQENNTKRNQNKMILGSLNLEFPSSFSPKYKASLAGFISREWQPIAGQRINTGWVLWNNQYTRVKVDGTDTMYWFNLPFGDCAIYFDHGGKLLLTPFQSWTAIWSESEWPNDPLRRRVGDQYPDTNEKVITDDLSLRGLPEIKRLRSKCFFGVE